MNAICSVARSHGLVVIEDAAQAHGAILDGRRPGRFGGAAAYSFYPTKNLGGIGDSGSVVSNDIELIDRVKTLRQGGNALALHSNGIGKNSRMDEVQAAVLRVKLRQLEKWNDRRRNLASIYDEVFSRGSVITRFIAGEPESHVNHLYVIRTKKRDSLREYLFSKGIETLVHYPFLLHQTPLFHRSAQASLQNAEGVVEG